MLLCFLRLTKPLSQASGCLWQSDVSRNTWHLCHEQHSGEIFHLQRQNMSPGYRFLAPRHDTDTKGQDCHFTMQKPTDEDMDATGYAAVCVMYSCIKSMCLSVHLRMCMCVCVCVCATREPMHKCKCRHVHVHAHG